MSISDSTQRYQETKKATQLAVATNFLLATVQILFGIIGNSQALYADGVHTLSDLISDIIILLAAKHANKGADDEHPYGHGRIETVATVFLGITLTAVGLNIGYDAIQTLINPQELAAPTIYAVIVAISAIISKELLFRYTLHTAKKINSPMLEANAWHQRSDVFSSIIVSIGLIATQFGYIYLDNVAALLVAAIIVKMGLTFLVKSFKELIDTALDEKITQQIKDICLQIEGVKSLHQLRTRQMAGYALADVHIQIDTKITVSEGHQIGDRVRYTLINSIQQLDDVVVHIDPEDDEDSNGCLDLPTRKEILEDISSCFAENNLPIIDEQIKLHYLNGKVEIDITWSLNSTEQIATIYDKAKLLANMIKQKDYIRSVQNFYTEK